VLVAITITLRRSAILPFSIIRHNYSTIKEEKRDLFDPGKSGGGEGERDHGSRVAEKASLIERGLFVFINN
jgi:hypothetical protein